MLDYPDCELEAAIVEEFANAAAADGKKVAPAVRFRSKG